MKKEEETLKTLIRYIIGDSLKKKNFFWVKNNVKSLPKKNKKFGQKPCKILTKKKMDEKKNETLKTLIRYIIGDSLKKKNFFLGQKQRKILTKKKQKIWSETM